MKIYKSELKKLIKEEVYKINQLREEVNVYTIENTIAKILKKEGFKVTNTFNGLLVQLSGKTFWLLIRSSKMP